MGTHEPLRPMHLSLRFIVPLALVLALLAYGLVPLVDRLTLRWWVNDLDIRSQFVANTLEQPLVELVAQGATAKIDQLMMRALQDERLYAIAYCDDAGKLRYATPTYPASLGCRPPAAESGETHSVIRLRQGPLHLVQQPVYDNGTRIGSLILVHDMSFVDRRSADTRRYLIGLFVLVGVVVSLVTVSIAHLSWRGWVSGVRALLRGEGILTPFSQSGNQAVHPLATELRTLLREMEQTRRRDQSTTWSPEMLRGVLREQLLGDEVIVVSNREPFIHQRHGETIELLRPASGLVTALEPVMRACSGTWIAHGSGSADRETVDKHDRLRVPPENPSYTLRRVWLSPEEEQGYYNGFANEGLWPLCHIAHVRPVFRSSDWDQYVKVNRRFADAVREEARTDDPVVLVQDYHLALLPRMIRERLPKATIITFWHIPWPNPESFGICPWREELLEGLLGSTILGLSHAFPLPEFRRDGRPLSRGPHRARIVDDLVWRPVESRRIVSDFDPVAAGMDRFATVGAAVPREGASRRETARRRPDRGWRRSPGLHQGDHRALPRRRAPARGPSRIHRPLCFRADCCAVAVVAGRVSEFRRRACARWRRASTRASAATATNRYDLKSNITARNWSMNTTGPPTSASSPACTTE